jgi:hypothetical protein
MKATLGPYALIPLALIQDDRITKNMLRVYAALAYHQGNNETTWPGVDRIAETSSVSRGDVSQNTKKLEQYGWITKTKRFSKSVVYRCLFPIDRVQKANSQGGTAPSIPETPDHSIPGNPTHSMPGNPGPKITNEDYQRKTKREEGPGPTGPEPFALSRSRSVEGETYRFSWQHFCELAERTGSEEEAQKVMDDCFLTKASYGREATVKDYAWLALQYLNSEIPEKDRGRESMAHSRRTFRRHQHVVDIEQRKAKLARQAIELQEEPLALDRRPTHRLTGCNLFLAKSRVQHAKLKTASQEPADREILHAC